MNTNTLNITLTETYMQYVLSGLMRLARLAAMVVEFHDPTIFMMGVVDTCKHSDTQVNKDSEC